MHPFQVFLPAEESGLSVDSKAQVEQVRSVSVERVLAKIGTLPPRLMLGVDEALALHLAL